MTTVPENGSEWLYQGKRVVVDQVYVQWSYKDSGYDSGYYEGSLSCFQPGKSFTPAPLEPVVGETYVEKGSIYPFTFVVNEVFEGRVYGREQGIGGHGNRWYGHSYNLTEFASLFGEST